MYRIVAFSSLNFKTAYKTIYYKDNKFINAYSSEGKVWKNLKNAEKALIKLSQKWKLLNNPYFAIEDANGDIVKVYDTTNKSWVANY